AVPDRLDFHVSHMWFWFWVEGWSVFFGDEARPPRRAQRASKMNGEDYFLFSSSTTSKSASTTSAFFSAFLPAPSVLSEFCAWPSPGPPAEAFPAACAAFCIS